MRAWLLGALLAALLAPVPASTAAHDEQVTSGPTELRLRNQIAIEGVLRYGRTVKVTRGTWNRNPDRYRFQWFRNETEIPGATRQTYRLGVGDVGQKLKARVYVKKRGYEWAQATARGEGRVGYRVPVRRTVTYRIETRGVISASVREFARLAAQTYADPRGWRNAGVAFRRVSGPSAFSLVLAEASWLPRFSSVCSVQWSCRAGRYVVINLTRWRFASPSWHAAGKTLRDYRHLVVNHETGHWLGHGHLGCPGPGRLAPVMMQQSKGLFGCRHNPWPLGSELLVPVTSRRVRLASGLHLAVHERGSGDPVVLVHAWGETHRTFDRLVPLLEPHVHVIAPDQRGVGESDKPAGGYALAQAALDLVELLDALAVRSAVLVGTSSGGYVAQQVTVEHPHRVHGLVLVGSPADLSGAGDPFGEVLARFHDPVTIEDVRAVNGSFATHAPIPHDFAAAQDAAALTIPRHAWRGVYRGLFEAPAPLAAGPVQVPALVLWGADDDLLPASQADDLAAGLPRGRVIRYADTGHLVLWERPDRVAADVLDLVASLRR